MGKITYIFQILFLGVLGLFFRKIEQVKKAPDFFHSIKTSFEFIDLSYIEKSGFNPSIANMGEYFILSYRLNQKKWTPFQEKWIHSYRSVQIVPLNHDLQPMCRPQTLQIHQKELSHPEDMRLFVFQDELWGIFTHSQEGIWEMWMGKIYGRDGMYHMYPKKLTYRVKNVKGKNWSPLEKDGELYLAYHLSPWTLLKVDQQTWICHEVEKTSLLSSDFGELRGGSPIIALHNGQYVGAYHGVIPTTYFLKKGESLSYFMGLYTIGKRNRVYPPLGFKGMTSHWKNHKKIVFPAGLCLDGNHLLMTFGINDAGMGAIRVPLSSLEEEE